MKYNRSEILCLFHGLFCIFRSICLCLDISLHLFSADLLSSSCDLGLFLLHPHSLLLMIKTHCNTEANGWNSFVIIVEVQHLTCYIKNKHLLWHWISPSRLLFHCIYTPGTESGMVSVPKHHANRHASYMLVIYFKFGVKIHFFEACAAVLAQNIFSWGAPQMYLFSKREGKKMKWRHLLAIGKLYIHCRI